VNFNGKHALEMFHRLHTLDYGSRRAGSKAADVRDMFIPIFHLDYFSMVGQPLKPITQHSDRFFDNVTVTFEHWHAPYKAKHQDLPFELDHRTFRLAKAATRETWFIVMHPIVAPTMELPSSGRQRRQQREKSSRSSALHVHHAQALASYIKEVFLAGKLLGERVEASWRLGSRLSQTLTSNTWTIFQELFMAGWAHYVEQQSCDPFWVQNEPAFHAYDYGANIEIQVSEELHSLAKETLMRPDDDSESESEEDEEVEIGHNNNTSNDVGDTREAALSAEAEVEADELYAEGLRQLITELEQKYLLDHVSSISYALAVDVHCMNGQTTFPHEMIGQEEESLAYCMLANRNMVVREYEKCADLTFYPMAFHPVYGNFSSPRPPRFLQDHVFAIMKDNMSFQNEGAEVLSCGYFQGYSNIKRSIRHNPKDLLVSQGMATAALTLPEVEAKASVHVRAKQQRLLERLQGNMTPEDRDASRPFSRERQRIEQAVAKDEFAFRMEQVMSVDVSRLVPGRRNFRTILRPILQLMRFFLKETEHYTHVLRCFRPTVFPTILASWARVFELAMGEMLLRFRAQGSAGLGLALAEGVAALDRLGHYCFTGLTQVLMKSVMEPLGTMDSLRNGAWPYVSPQMLDLRKGEGRVDVMRWPRGQDDRPIFMHVASLAFHYGPEVAAGHHSLLWFRDLGGKSIKGPTGATRFLDEVFRELWVPEMKSFISFQLHRRLRQRSGALEEAQSQRSLIESWMESEKPFSRRWVGALSVWMVISQTIV